MLRELCVGDSIIWREETLPRLLLNLFTEIHIEQSETSVFLPLAEKVTLAFVH